MTAVSLALGSAAASTQPQAAPPAGSPSAMAEAGHEFKAGVAAFKQSDGTSIDESVVPNAAALIRVRKPAAAAGAKGPGGRPAPSDGKPPALRYEKSPYE